MEAYLAMQHAGFTTLTVPPGEAQEAAAACTDIVVLDEPAKKRRKFKGPPES